MSEDIIHNIHPKLADEIGLSESILLLQINFWAATSDDKRCIREGKRWTYQSYSDMHEKIPYLSESTLKRAVASLKKQGLIQVGNFNRVKYDRTNWYRIDEDGVGRLKSLRLRDASPDVMESPKVDAPSVQSELTIPEGTSEVLTEVTSDSRYTEPKFCGDQNFGNEGSVPVADAPRNTEGQGLSAYDEALRALEVFESVGVKRFDVTFKNDRSGEIKFFENINLREKLERALELNDEGWSFIVRPNATNLIQVDDVSVEGVRVLSPFSFFSEETSQENYQVWLALPEETDSEKVKEIRQRLLRHLNGDGNGGAYGATRWAGSKNQKPERDGFRVRIIDASKGWFTSEAELVEAELLAEMPKDDSSKSLSESFKGRLPDYSKCLEAKGGDRSRADVSFLYLARQRGFSRDEAVHGLETVSERARESGNAYIRRTADFVYR